MPLWRSFFVAFLGTLGAVVALGLVVSNALVKPPPKRVMTASFQMDLADGWACYQEGLTWTCDLADTTEKDTVAVFAIKYRGGEDTPEAYSKYLSIPRPLVMQNGEKQNSQVQHVKLRRIGNYEWVDALHYGSEIGTYYTHYLATVTSHIAILVTFSAHKDAFDRYNRQFEQMIESLLVYQRPLNTDGQSAGSVAPVRDPNQGE